MGMDIIGNSGKYFRANIWSWRAIRDVMELSGIDVPGSWSCNDGEGCDDPDECRNMAGKIEAFLKARDAEYISTPSSNGMGVDINGRFVPADTKGARSPYRVYRDHLSEFVEFLKTCEGFEIC